jgi:hypothetical protein
MSDDLLRPDADDLNVPRDPEHPDAPASGAVLGASHAPIGNDAVTREVMREAQHEERTSEDLAAELHGRIASGSQHA